MKILNIGRFTEQKDQMTFLKALNQIKGIIKFEAVIVGRGKLHKDLLEYIERNELKQFCKNN